MTRHDRLKRIASRRTMAGKWVPFQLFTAQRWQARNLGAWRTSTLQWARYQGKSAALGRTLSTSRTEWWKG